MGYTTRFEGQFNLDKPLSAEHKAYLEKFAYVRHMRRDVSILANRPDSVREAVRLPLGNQGMYYTGSTALFGQDEPDKPYYQNPDPSVLDFNQEPAGMPGLWCQWVPNEQGTALVWDEGEKFYDYVEWLEFLMVHFLKPWEYVVNGTVQWQGEDPSDTGTITVTANVVSVA